MCTEPLIKSDHTCGTPHYMAPEVIHRESYSSIIDWWAFGILIFEMLYGIPPFRGDNTSEIFNSVCKCHLEFPNNTPCKCKLSSQVKNLIKKLLEYIPEKRLGFKGGSTEIKDHPFFKNVKFQLLKNQIPPIIPKLMGPLDHHYFNTKTIQHNLIENDTNILDSKMINDKWNVFNNHNVNIV